MRSASGHVSFDTQALPIDLLQACTWLMRLASVSLLAQFTPCPAGLRSRRPLPVAACLAPRTTAGVSNGEQAQASSLLREVPVQVSAQGAQEPQLAGPLACTGHTTLCAHMWLPADPWASDTFRQELRQRLVRLYDSASFRQGGKLLPPNLPTAQACTRLMFGALLRSLHGAYMTA